VRDWGGGQFKLADGDKKRPEESRGGICSTADTINLDYVGREVQYARWARLVKSGAVSETGLFHKGESPAFLELNEVG